MSGSSGSIYGPNQNSLINANAAYSGLIPSLQGVSGYAPGVTSSVQGTTNLLANNPYYQGALSGAQTFGQYGTGTLSPQQQSGATSLFNTGGAQAGYVPQALATGFDPQNAVYAQQYQRMLDQSGAINAMNGIAGTPYGAGVTNTASQNFNTDWLANAQARQGAAAQTANTLSGGAGTAYQTGSALGTGAIQTGAGSAQLPYTTYANNLLQNLNAINTGTGAVSGATGATTDAMSQLLSYLGYGTQATNLQQQQSNQTWSGIGQALGGLAGLSTGGGGTLLGDALAAI